LVAVADSVNCSVDRMITFGPFVLIPSQQLLLKTDQLVQIGTRAFEILTCLVERAGEVVSKEDLIARVWPTFSFRKETLTSTWPLCDRR
jgi:DNA-binding winged helix-turn-helix (wHTH) protein